MTTPLDILRAQHEALNLRAEIATLEKIVRGEEMTSRLVESEWGELVNRREYLTDTPGWGMADYRATTPSDRVGGKCSPFFENEFDLANIRGIGRYLAGATEVAIGALESLVSFTIGTGLTYEVAPKNETSNKDSLVEAVQVAVDEILEANQWIGDQEAEAFLRSSRDGECLLWAQDRADVPHIRIIEPDYLTEPSQTRELEDYLGLEGLCWTFGIATDHGNVERRHGYFIQWNGSKCDWDFAPEREAVHIRLNVDRGVKRGISDFYAAYMTLERASKLLGNTLQGAAIQATIAYIREHAAGTTQGSVESFRASKSTSNYQQSLANGSSRTVYQERFKPGRVIDTAGSKYHAGPLGQSNAPIYVNVMQAALRIVGARWQMPEYMISGDASNANYSSTLVSGGPFDRATQRRQAFYRRKFAELVWKCLAHLVRRGRFLQFNIGTLTELKRQVQLKIDAPDVDVKDKEAEERVRDSQQRAGILSPRTRAQKSGLDYDIEIANGAKASTPAPFQLLDPRRQGVPTTTQSAIAAALESVQTTDEARAVLRDCYP